MRLCQPEGSHHVSPLQTLRWLIWDTCKHLTASELYGDPAAIQRGREERLPNLDFPSHHATIWPSDWNFLIPFKRWRKDTRAIQAFHLAAIRQGHLYSSHTKDKSSLLYCCHYTTLQNKIKVYRAHYNVYVQHLVFQHLSFNAQVYIYIHLIRNMGKKRPLMTPTFTIRQIMGV